MEYQYSIPAIDRILLITWLLKDFGWMSTNIYLGLFVVHCVIFHEFIDVGTFRMAVWYGCNILSLFGRSFRSSQVISSIQFVVLVLGLR